MEQKHYSHYWDLNCSNNKYIKSYIQVVLGILNKEKEELPKHSLIKMHTAKSN